MESENRTIVKKWLSDIKYFSLREAKETRIANNILVKIIKNVVGFSKEKPTEEELKFLKLHSRDLVKILGFIATGPTPIPYILISLVIKKFGLDLFPSKDDLEIPGNHKKSNIK